MDTRIENQNECLSNEYINNSTTNTSCDNGTPMTIEQIITNAFKYESTMPKEEKIYLTSYIIQHIYFITKLEDFYEEECHLTLVNWIWNLRHKIKGNENLDEFDYYLINNILIIFEKIPILTKDLFDLKIYQKLNKIRKYMKKINNLLFVKLDNLLNYWKSFCDEQSFMILQKKRCRDEDQEYSEKIRDESKVTNIVKINNNCEEENKYLYEKKNINIKNGILKYSNHEKRGLKVQFLDKEDVKIFKFYDSPNTPGISQEEYMLINSFISNQKNENIKNEKNFEEEKVEKQKKF